MKIQIKKGEKRNRLVCEQQDGGTEIADLGPSLPNHDIAHIVIERHFGLKQGFYGNIYAGHSVNQLSQKEVIAQLDPESMLAEVLTRALQSMLSGACLPEQFADLTRNELEAYGIPTDQLILDKASAEHLLSDYKHAIEGWKQTPVGDSMEFSLDFI